MVERKWYVQADAEKHTYVYKRMKCSDRNKSLEELIASSLCNFAVLKKTQVQVAMWKQ